MINKQYLTIYGPALLAALIGFWIAYQFVQPAPPDRIVVTTGGKEGAYYMFAQQYREILARNGITLDIRNSHGSVENIERLQAKTADLAFVQGGTSRSTNPQDLFSLSSLYYEPLWVFYRGDDELTRLINLRGKRLAVGPEGSGTRFVALQLLKDNGVAGPPTVVSSLGGQKAANALLSGDVDGAIFVASLRAPIVQKLLTAPDLRLMSFERAEAYTRRHRYLSSVPLPQGVVDLEKNIPPVDTILIAPTANLVVRKDFHPALADLLLQAATEIHGSGDVFERGGEFPSAKYLEFPLSKEAERYYKHGPSFLQRYLPFWAATLVQRMVVMLIPLVALLFPLFKIVPPTYRWRVRSRIYRWYKDVKAVDMGFEGDWSPERLSVYLTELDRIEDEVNKIPTPLAYADKLYDLRMHINLVRERLTGARKDLKT